jgi:hypothetical protein
MYSTLLIVILFGAYLFYNTSKKVKFGPRPQWLGKLCAQTKFVRTLSILLLLFPFSAVLYMQGFGAGFFCFFCLFHVHDVSCSPIESLSLFQIIPNCGIVCI